MIKLTVLSLAGLWIVGHWALGVTSGSLGVLSILLVLAALALDAWQSQQVQSAAEGARKSHLASEREFADITRRNRGD